MDTETITVSEIIQIDRLKRRVRFEEGSSLVLYAGEIRRYHLIEGENISSFDYMKLHEVLSLRAKKRCLHLLEATEKTEQQLRRKLTEGGYPSDIVDEAIQYVQSYHYIDDDRYAREYIRQKQRNRSICQLKQDLRRRGVGEPVIAEALQEIEPDEGESLRRLAEKKCRNCDLSDRKSQQKLGRYFASKGYSYEQIRHVFSQMTGDVAPLDNT